jgi:hypothetical protein
MVFAALKSDSIDNLAIRGLVQKYFQILKKGNGIEVGNG